jgi:hypothetical protein
MANYVVSKLVENGIVGGGETVDFKRGNFVLNESNYLGCASRSHAMGSVKKQATQSGWLDEG